MLWLLSIGFSQIEVIKFPANKKEADPLRVSLRDNKTPNTIIQAIKLNQSRGSHH